MQINKDLLVKAQVEEELLKQKKAYLDMVVNEFTTPIMREACVKAKEDAILDGNKERAKAMESTIAVHDKNLAAFAEAKGFTEQTIAFLGTLK